MKKKVLFIICGILLLVIILIAAYFIDMNNIIENAYIRIVNPVFWDCPNVDGAKCEPYWYKEYYISKSGIVIKSSKENGVKKKYYLKKLKNKDLEEIENYVLHNISSENYIDGIRFYIKDKNITKFISRKDFNYLIDTYMSD